MEALYLGYADFYSVQTDEEKLSTLFGWLLDVDHVCDGILAVMATGEIVGLAHFRGMPSPLRGAEIGFLDDLFVDPAARGSGAADALLKQVDRNRRRPGLGCRQVDYKGMEIIVPAAFMTVLR